ncbi:MAG: homoprotocatechuate degradation operon regulator HpaR [Rhizobiaceae bacterium]
MARNSRTRPEAIDDPLIPPNMRRSLIIALVRGREAVMGRFRPVLSPYDLTEQQWRVIRVLADESPLDASEVASRSAVLAPSLTRILRTLEERRLVRRRRDIEDQRRARLELAPGGVALLREVVPQSRLVYEEIERRFGRERLDQLLDLLGELGDLKP